MRPIIVPRDLSNIPWNTGYAEYVLFEFQILSYYKQYKQFTKIVIFRTINSGKSKKNEDQARIHSSVLNIPVNDNDESLNSRNKNRNKSSIEHNGNSVQEFVEIPYRYFGMFDGHAGPGCAVAAASRLHQIIHVILEVILT